jgi:hypothetical protein
MNSMRIQLLLTGVAAWISLLLMITPTYGASIVIGGNYTDIGTIIFVSPKPGDLPTTAGTALLNTLNGIADNSATNPYLIKLCPGIYDLGTNSLQMKQYVDLEGSGENTTIITGNIDSQISGVVRGAINAEIRFLAVRNTGGGSFAIAIYNQNASPKITNVTASASGGTSNYGVYSVSFSPTMTNMTVSASGGTNNFGVFNNSSSPTMTNMTASALGGTFNSGVYSWNTGTIRIHHSVIKGTMHTVFNGPGTTTFVGNTQLDGGAVSNSGTLTCAGVYDENYTFYPSTCP